MRVILVRHAEAAPGSPDDARSLTPEGREAARRLGERLAPGASPDEVRAAVADRGETVVVVGHQPDCGDAVLALTGREVAFPPAGTAEVEL